MLMKVRRTRNVSARRIRSTMKKLQRKGINGRNTFKFYSQQQKLLRIDTPTMIKKGLELKQDLNHKKIRESKIHSMGHGNTGHPKIISAPI